MFIVVRQGSSLLEVDGLGCSGNQLTKQGDVPIREKG